MNGEEIVTSSFKSTIKEFLDEQGIKYDSNDRITPNLDTKLKDNIQINIVKVDIKEQKEYEKVPFNTTVNEDVIISSPFIIIFICSFFSMQCENIDIVSIRIKNKNTTILLLFSLIFIYPPFKFNILF